jgi:hypothetical protein
MALGISVAFDKPPVGRQGLSDLWTPSGKRPLWFGTIRGAERTAIAFVGGERFTEEQEAALISLGRDVLTAPAMLVKRQAGDELTCGQYDLPEVFHFECPVTGKVKADGKIQVITPSGATAWVYPDGWAQRPLRTPAAYSVRRY